jgi:hypothetical protein
MSCKLTNGINLKDCDTPGGVSESYFINIEDVATLTVTDFQVSALTLKSTTKAYKIAFEPQTSNFASNAVGSVENSSAAYEQTCEIKINKMDNNVLKQIEALTKGRHLVIIKKADGTYELYFHEGGAKFVADYSTGTAFEDPSGVTLTATHRQPSNMLIVSGTVIPTLTIAEETETPPGTP